MRRPSAYELIAFAVSEAKRINMPRAQYTESMEAFQRGIDQCLGSTIEIQMDKLGDGVYGVVSSAACPTTAEVTAIVAARKK